MVNWSPRDDVLIVEMTMSWPMKAVLRWEKSYAGTRIGVTSGGKVEPDPSRVKADTWKFPAASKCLVTAEPMFPDAWKVSVHH